MRLVFIHRDRRAEPVANASALRHVGGIAAHPAAIVDQVLTATEHLDLELWVTWSGNRLPKPPRGQVVLLVVGDESGQAPEHAKDFICAFSWGTRSLGRPPPIVSAAAAWTAALELTRMARNGLQRLLRSMRCGAPFRRPASLYAFPLGPTQIKHGLGATAPTDFQARTWDIVFLGSIGRTAKTPWPFGGRIGLSPKAASRLSVIRALRDASVAGSTLKVLVGCADHPQFGPPLDQDAYRAALTDAKISLCPRGNFPETFRHAEAAEAGSIVMTDPLPDEWYFSDHPFIVIDDWTTAVARAQSILSDPVAASNLALACRRWYETKCSPEAVARFIVSKVMTHIPTPAAVARGSE